jgi:hypothetical protein
MKFHFLISLILITSGSQLMAKHVPKKVMLYYCSEVAAVEYDVPLEAIETQMPVLKKNGYTVHGEVRRSRHHRHTRFVCQYDAHGKFQFIKKQLPHNREIIKKRIKRACKTEAASQWHTSPRDIRIAHVTKRNENRFEVTLEGADATGSCIVNKQGHIYRFDTTYKERPVPERARISCRKKAAYHWHVPASFTRIERAEYIGRNRYILELSGGYRHAECEVKGTGEILHFRGENYRR